MSLVPALLLLSLLPSTSKKTRELITFFVGVPWFACLISFDRLAPALNPFVRFPRSGSVLLTSPVTLLTLLVDEGAVPRGSKLLGLVRDGGLVAEPAKNAQISRLKLAYSPPGGQPTELRVFVKCQAERGTTLLARSIAAAFSPVHTEVAYYTRIVPALAAATGAPHVPSPRCLATRYSRSFSRVMTILETIGDDFESTPDWKVRGKRKGDLFSL